MDEIDDDLRDRLIQIIQSENDRAIGFDAYRSSEISEQRAKALDYAKGVMEDLPQTLAGRSRVVSTDVSDAIETAMPDLIDIFTADDETIVFDPVEEGDIESAKQETDYLNHVVFQKNDGWKVYYEVIKDALLTKTGVIGWRWEGEYTPPVEYHTGRTIQDVITAQLNPELRIENIEQDVNEETGEVLFSYELSPVSVKGRVCIEAIPSEDLAVAIDTKRLATATYCCVRSRPRAQDLIALGFDYDLVMGLPPYNDDGNNLVEYARDTVGEYNRIIDVEAYGIMGQREIYRHYIRYYHEDEKRWCIYQIITGGSSNMKTVLDIQKVSRIPLAAITPYLNPHRFYGESVADRLLEIQRIKTFLMRLTIDNGLFSLNQRNQISEQDSTEDTIADYLNNVPGGLIRTKTGNAVIPVQAGGLNYDPLSHLEYFSVQGEGRTGIMRNAQGMNPDTLHDTKGGAEILINAAQKRLRLIARTFAETGFKDFLVNLHATIREHGQSLKDTVRLRGKNFVQIDPSTWRQRDDMVIQIGVGAGGRDYNLMVSQRLEQTIEKLVTVQGGPEGPLVNLGNIYAAAQFSMTALGIKNPDAYVSDPDNYQPPQPQGPSPDEAQAQAEVQQEQARLQFERDKAAIELEMSREKSEQEMALKREEAEFKAALEQQKIDAQMIAERQRAEFEAQMAREKMTLEAQLAREKMAMEAELAAERAAIDGAIRSSESEAKISSYRTGGDLDK